MQPDCSIYIWEAMLLLTGDLCIGLLFNAITLARQDD
jgi:hypothetical protein